MSKKHKKICTDLIYIKCLLILASPITGYVAISVFASLVAATTGIFKFCSRIEEFKNTMSGI